MKCAPLMIILFDGVSVWLPIDRSLIKSREHSAISLHMPGENRADVNIIKPKHITCFISTIAQF